MGVASKKIKVHTEDLNRSKYWIKTDGIDTSNFEKNNVVLYEHDFGQRIGLGVNLTKEANGDMWAEIDFNENSELGKRLKQEFEEGYIKAASIGVLPKKFSKDTQFLKMGQSLPTMIECELIEFSLVSVPNNAGAVAFKNSENGYVKLSITDLKFEESPVLGSESTQTEHKISDMKKIAILLGLSETASEEEILKKLAELQTASKTAQAVITQAAEPADLAPLRKAVLALGEKLGVVTEVNKATYERIANVDVALAMDMVTENMSLSKPAAKTEDVRVTTLVEAMKVEAQKVDTQGQKKERPKEYVNSGKSMQERMVKELAK